MNEPATTFRHRASALRRRHAVKEYRALRRVVRRLGYHLVPATYYSPIPDLDAIPARAWAQAAEMPGVAWDMDAQLAFLETELAALVTEHDAPADPPGTDTGFYRRNPNFPGLDAEILYAMVRRFTPARVLEFGAGFSTLVIESAAQRNRSQGSPLRHEVYDPFPSPTIDCVRHHIELCSAPATEIPARYLAQLEPNDILFIDTTHTVKLGGDVVHLLLGALPLIAPGVLVHLHDFYRPFEYPYSLMDAFGSYWQEHYLIQAFLSLNPEFEVICANHALHRLHGDRIQALVPTLDRAAEPSSLWIRRLTPAPAVNGGEPVSAP